MQANMGMAGEFRCVVKRADGSTKIDTGYQKNLILNQGLDFFGFGTNVGNVESIMNYCIIGSGNSTPTYAQNKLDNAIAGVSGSGFSSKYDYNASKDGNLYKTNRVCKYSFSGLNNVNVSEVGLAIAYSDTSNYSLCTRALIKDSNGNPTTITVLNGEKLDIYYKLWKVYDITDKNGVINILDGASGSVAYNYILRLAGVGTDSFFSSNNPGNLPSFKTNLYMGYSELSNITSYPSGSLANNTSTAANYNPGTYKRTVTCSVSTDNANGSIRNVYIDVNALCRWQIRFGSVADDSPITKTATQTLTLPFEFSWGRYEGAL